MATDDTEQRVREFVHQKVPWLPVNMPADTDVVNDGKIYGDDVWALVDEFSKRFNVEMRDLRWYHHTGPEGCNPLWLFYRPLWNRKTHVPIRLSDLIESSRRGVWGIKYPENEHVG